jgi:Cu(I)/Ag(I) efflux system membrane fusion protein
MAMVHQCARISWQTITMLLRSAALAMFVLQLAGCSDEFSIPPESEADSNTLEHARKHLDPAYVCPMHPQIVRDTQGTCPICGMDLVEKTQEPDATERPVVELSSATLQNLGVRTAPVERHTLWKYIRTQGTVAYDDERIRHIHARTSGWIENLYVWSEGERVERKDDLADFVSPEVLRAQVNYIESLEEDDLSSFGQRKRARETETTDLLGSRELLRYFNVPEMYLKTIDDTRQLRDLIPIKAPQGGVLTLHNASEGMYVEPWDRLFTIVDLSEVWVMVDIYEHQIAWIRPELKAEISTPAYPGRTWEGEVEFVYPEVDPEARTLKARLEFANPGELLLPNMFVEVVIYGGPKADVLVIPREALIVTGEREIVVRALGKGRFESTNVVTGMWRGEHVEVLSGLEAGDEVVVSGQFLIDSESNLKASFDQMAE